MATTTAPRQEASIRDPGFLAFWLLRLGFTAAPILAGLDKFFNWMVDWDRYLWSGFADLLPGSAQQVMYGVGVIEVAAGVVVLLAPRFGGALVAAWLGGIILNLVLVGIAEGEYWDIALRDLGLMLGAISLSLLAGRYGSGSAGVRGGESGRARAS